MSGYKGDYTLKEFRRDVKCAEDSYGRGDITWESYRDKVRTFAHWYGEDRKEAVNILNNRGFSE